jgi:hypothetical protein
LACILVKPNGKQKGILSVTTSELDQVTNRGQLIEDILGIKDLYYLGLHYNWHPVDFEISEEFDFHFLESKDAIFLNGSENLLEMDACNFTPSYFSNPRNIPVWDVLIVGRTANFKRPFKTLETVRELFDRGHLLKVLWICPMDLENTDDKAVAEGYEKLFCRSEKELFTLLNPQSNFPFTFSRQELSLFYLSSRSYVHFADVETRCRVAAYAFCAGIPVIGHSMIANILTEELAVEPTFYEVKNDDYVTSILEAIYKPMKSNRSGCIDILSEGNSINRLVANLNQCLNPKQEFIATQFFLSNLDNRLGAAHSGNESSNSYGIDLLTFIKGLKNENADNLFKNIPINSSSPEHEFGSLAILELNKSYPTLSFDLKKYRKSEIRISRNGQVRFNLYRVIKFVNTLPLIGIVMRRLLKTSKSVVKSLKI